MSTGRTARLGAGADLGEHWFWAHMPHCCGLPPSFAPPSLMPPSLMPPSLMHFATTWNVIYVPA
jgi:hypothetical protein